MYHTLNSVQFSKSYKRKTFFVIFKKRQKTSKNRVSNLITFCNKKSRYNNSLFFVFALELINIPMLVVNKIPKDQEIFLKIKLTKMKVKFDTQVLLECM